jgi:CRP-like cAMP-binding protein
VWTQDENKLLHTHAYHVTAPEIITLELAGPVFFGSSLSLLTQMAEDLGLRLENFDAPHAGQCPGQSPMPSSPMHRTPHTSFVAMQRTPSFIQKPRKRNRVRKHPPKFCVLDLSAVSSFDASAARACFLQFVKMCTKKGTVVCAAGATPRIDWMLRAHGIAFESAEEEKVKARFESMSAVEPMSRRAVETTADHVLLFLTIHEALEFCEGRVIRRLSGNTSEPSSSSFDMASSEAQSLGSVFARILDSQPAEEETLRRFDAKKYHREIEFKAGQKIFAHYGISDALYVVLKGAVASSVGRAQTIYRHRQQIVSGAGLVKTHAPSSSRLLDPELHETGQAPVVATLWPVGGIIGYSDLLLDRPYCFGAFATQSGTLVARITRADMTLLKTEEPKLDALLNRVLLRTSILDLSNCTCDDV